MKPDSEEFYLLFCLMQYISTHKKPLPVKLCAYPILTNDIDFQICHGVTGQTKMSVIFFHKIKHTFFFFITDFIDLHMLYLPLLTSSGQSPGVLINIFQCIRQPPQQRVIWPKCQQYQETLQTSFDTDQLQHLLHTLHKSFLFAFQFHFYLI